MESNRLWSHSVCLLKSLDVVVLEAENKFTFSEKCYEDNRFFSPHHPATNLEELTDRIV